MDRMIMRTMTAAQLAQFVAANGLRRDGRALLAPEGQIVGRIVETGPASVGVATVEETYSDNDSEVTAWWPSFRPAWRIVAADGSGDEGDPLGPGEVICDVCNGEVVVRPVPVVNGYARCATCFASLDLVIPGSVPLYCPLRTDKHAGGDR